MHLNTSSLWLTILMTSYTLASSTPSYFNITSVSSLINDRTIGGFDSVGMNLEDPATHTSAGCGVSFNSSMPNTIDGYAPLEWIECDDPTFTFRVESYISSVQYRLGIRHQYRRNGIPCIKSSGPQCITRLGYVDFNSSAPEFGYYNPNNGYSSGMSSGEEGAAAGPFLAPVYRHCYSCANNKIGGS